MNFTQETTTTATKPNLTVDQANARQLLDEAREQLRKANRAARAIRLLDKARKRLDAETVKFQEQEDKMRRAQRYVAALESDVRAMR